jgi:hypothetical protein
MLNSKKDGIFILLTVILMIAFLGRYKIALERNISMIMPFFALGVCSGVHYLRENCKKITLSIIIMAISLNVIIYTVYSARESNLVKAEKWIDENIKRESTIYTTRYSPYINKEYYHNIFEKNFFDIHLARENEFFAVSSLQYERYYLLDESRYPSNFIYPDKKKKCDDFFNSLHLVKKFPGILTFGWGKNMDGSLYYKLIRNIFISDVSLFETVDIYTYKKNE